MLKTIYDPFILLIQPSALAHSNLLTEPHSLCTAVKLWEHLISFCLYFLLSFDSFRFLYLRGDRMNENGALAKEAYLL
jgi:hypothetical protein